MSCKNSLAPTKGLIYFLNNGYLFAKSVASALESNIGLNAIAHYAAKVYGPNVKMPQGLGTGQLFTDNIPMPLEIRGDQLFLVK